MMEASNRWHEEKDNAACVLHDIKTAFIIQSINSDIKGWFPV